jgi:hypothetical protein
MNSQEITHTQKPRGDWLRASALALVIVWSLVELPAESALAHGSSERLALWCSKLIVSFLALLAGLRVRWAENIFTFICALSVLVIVPALYTELSASQTAFLYSLIECIVKAMMLATLVLRGR